MPETVSPEPSPPPPGYGDFEIARREDGSLWELGRGAMGVTYKAVDRVLHRSVALKVIQFGAARASDTKNGDALRQRFLREARAAAALRHPNVAGVFQFGVSEQAGSCYYAMELVEGETLEARVRRAGPLAVGAALEVGRQVATALVAAGGRGLIHRDLKPGNLMLSGSDAASAGLEVKVIDFGLAKVADAGVDVKVSDFGLAEVAAVPPGEANLTHGGFVGTPAFASPEQFARGPVDARSDFYSLGITLWFALTGEVPFTGRTLEELRDQATRAHPPVERLVKRGVPKGVIALLRRLLAVDPAGRPASANELMSALAECQAKLAGGRARSLARRRLALTALALASAGGAWWWAQVRASHDNRAVAAPVTTDLKAYALYTRARSIYVFDDPGGATGSVRAKITLLEEAVRRAPDFALAYCELSKTYDDYEEMAGDHQHLEPARQAVEKALQLQPGLGEAHRELARYYLHAGDFSRAYKEAVVATRTLPNDAEVHRIVGEAAANQDHWEQALPEMEKAHELDPSDYEIEYHLAALRLSMRRYHEMEQALLRERPVSRMDANWEHILMAESKLATGDLAAARAYIARVPPDFSPTMEFAWTRFNAALCLRDYDSAEGEIAATSPQWMGELFAGISPQTWDDGMLARLRGDEAKARAIFTAAREWKTTAWDVEKRDHIHYRVLSLCDAALGRKEGAIREARHVCEEWPLARNPSIAKAYMQNLALVYALTGERAQAIDELAIVSKMDDTTTYGDLRYSPYWDALRGDPRFEAIVASLAPKP